MPSLDRRHHVQCLHPVEYSPSALRQADNLDPWLQLWFATALRDGISLSAAGDYATFREVASNAVRTLLTRTGSAANTDRAAETVIEGFGEVEAHSDVRPGLQAIHNSGIKVMAVTMPAPSHERQVILCLLTGTACTAHLHPY